VETNKDAAVRGFGRASQWMIAALQNDYQFCGAGYYYDIINPFTKFGFGVKLIWKTATLLLEMQTLAPETPAVKAFLKHFLIFSLTRYSL
jgi:hypothetical protein